MASEPRVSESATFAQALAALKRRGSNLLLVGAGCERAHLAASRRLLGSDTSEPKRERVVVLAGAPDDAESRLRDLDPETVRTLRYDSLTRGAAAAQPSGPSTTGLGRRNSLQTFESDVLETIDGVEATRGALDPAQLRVCVDSLVPIVETFGEEATHETLHRLTDAVRDRRGMAHYHLPVDPSDRHVRALSPLFEAVVELKNGPDGPEQRWLLTESGAATDWLDV